jgi:hypothetical protein
MIGEATDASSRNSNIVFRNYEGGANIQEGIVVMFTDNIIIENCHLFNFRVNIYEYHQGQEHRTTGIKIWNSIFHCDTSIVGYSPKLLMFTSHTVPEIQMDYNCVLNPWYNNS